MLFHRYHRHRIGLIKAVVVFVAVLLLEGLGLPAWSQLPSLPVSTPNILLQESTSRPPSTVKQLGPIEVAPVKLVGEVLFEVTAPTVVDRQNPGDQVPVEVRARVIENSLAEIVLPPRTWGNPIEGLNKTAWNSSNELYDLETLRVEIATLNRQTILMANDANHPQAVTLLTVTDLDARYHGTTIENLAQRWQEALQTALVNVLRQQQPEVVKRQIQRASAITLGMVVSSLLLWGLLRWLRFRQKQLERQHHAEAAVVTPEPPPTEENLWVGQRSQFLNGLRSQFNLERRLSLVALLQWLAVWGQAVVWIGGLLWIYSLFPATAPLVETVSTRLLTLLLIWFTIGLLNRLGNLAINRLAQAWEDSEFLLPEADQRRSLRIPTIVRALKGFKTFTVYLLALGWAMKVFGFSLSSVLTLSAVLALAVSFASQSLVKDLVNGFLILLEDQYAIGDYISLGTVAGLVENLNLRITQLRNVEGRLITIPNSQISQVENWTRIWSRVDFKVTVAYDTDVKRAIAVVEQCAQRLYKDPCWSNRLLKPPQMLGVEQIGHEGMVIRMWLITKPMQQFDVKREMNRLVRLALAEAKISVGMPQQRILYEYQPLSEKSEDLGKTNGSGPFPHPVLPEPPQEPYQG
ncbi:MAG TPA: mechanosensitive ion channel family protein [Leptolyngbyaceae cyanobacterium]